MVKEEMRQCRHDESHTSRRLIFSSSVEQLPLLMVSRRRQLEIGKRLASKKRIGKHLKSVA
jgi:hypothetical protein